MVSPSPVADGVVLYDFRHPSKHRRESIHASLEFFRSPVCPVRQPSDSRLRTGLCVGSSDFHACRRCGRELGAGSAQPSGGRTADHQPAEGCDLSEPYRPETGALGSAAYFQSGGGGS